MMQGRDAALRGAIAVALAGCSALGLAVPSVLSSNSKLKLNLLAQVSAGVVLAVAWLHLLDEAQDRLEGLVSYPAANVTMLAGFLVMTFVDMFSHSHERQLATNREQLLPKGSGGTRPRLTLSFMETSISLHSVLIGVSLGSADTSWRQLLLLGLVLCVHQFLEGCALGLVATRSELGWWGWTRVYVLFSLSVPVGVTLGVVLLRAVETSEGGASLDEVAAYRWVAGLANAFAAGTLTHVGVEMISHELHGPHAGHDAGPPREHDAGRSDGTCPTSILLPHGAHHPVMGMAAVLFGAATMCVLAAWA